MRLSLFRPPTPALLAAALLATLALPAAACPDWRLNGQTDTLTGGQSRVYTYQAGGPDNLSNCPMPGSGRVTTAPQLTLTLRGQPPGADLSFRVEAPCDTVLLVNDASAQWHFNDDTNGLNPAVTLRGARDGIYDVWVGTFGQTSCQAQLYVQSGSGAPSQPQGGCPDWRLSGLPMELNAGSLSGARQQLTVRAGGGTNLSQCPEPGVGHVGPAPQVELTVRGLTGQALDFAVSASCDTVLLVNDARGQWHFNDDSQGLNPGLSLPGAADGVYDVWVGTYGPSGCDATLTVQAAGTAPPPPACPDPNLTGAIQSMTWAGLRGGLSLPMRAGGAARLGDCAGLPGSGHVDARPQVTLDLADAPQGGRLEIAGTASCDAVLLVRDAQGRWNFNDDTDGLNPRLTLEPATAGRYGIWLGTWGPTPCDGTLQIRGISPEPTKPGQPPTPSALPDPGNLMGFRNQVGQTLTFSVTGAAGGSVWGDGIYTDDSSLARAAVHAGVLQVGQSGTIRVTILPGQSSYAASSRNGVQTSSYGNWSGSFRIEGAPAVQPPQPGVLPDPGNLTGFRDRVGQTLSFTVTGAAGGAIWGDGVYTDDSILARAAVHAGALQVGQTGTIRVTIMPGQSSYPASSRNGVQSGSWGAWSGSYRIEGAGMTPAAPAAAGTWQLVGNGYRGRLVLEWTGSGWTGHMNYDVHGRDEPLTDIRFDSSTGAIEMTRPIPGATQIYRGTLRGTTMEGQFNQSGGGFIYNWTATR